MISTLCYIPNTIFYSSGRYAPWSTSTLCYIPGLLLNQCLLSSCCCLVSPTVKCVASPSVGFKRSHRMSWSTISLSWYRRSRARRTRRTLWPSFCSSERSCHRGSRITCTGC
uniref:Uncharacterized protein n=1 Tax=Cacopsylla melanoneura TaxID=428564 RepID=A0A8D9DZG0_9HEMI